MEEKKIKPIEELYKELTQHPDFLFGDYYTISDCIEHSNEMNEDDDEENFVPINKNEIDEELKEKIIEHISNELYIIFKHTDTPYPVIKRNALTGKLTIEN